jgi:FKBP-type peptidyl-prolyl cis-trans isomerase (trigger factor)
MNNETAVPSSSFAIVYTASLFPDFSFCIAQRDSVLSQIVVTVPSYIVEKIFSIAAQNEQATITSPGFENNIPISYVRQHYATHLYAHAKEFMLKYSIINYVYHILRLNKVPFITDPVLEDIIMTDDRTMQYHFTIHRIHDIVMQDWKLFPFKSPPRKNYKDIDRQAEQFIAQELNAFAASGSNQTICINDWVCFDVTLVDCNGAHHIPGFTQNFWFKITDEELDNPLRDLFIGKKKYDSFISDNRGLQEGFSALLDTRYTFLVTIVDVVPYIYICLELFKNFFKIKTNKDLHKKIVEIFSYRNDVSQRHAIIEETFKVLLAKHQFHVPEHLILRQQQNILEIIRDNPDYNVYRKQKEFSSFSQQLARKQIQELIFIMQFAFDENICVTHDDLKAYIMLSQRNRTKEFLHFGIPDSKNGGEEIMIPTEHLYISCLREKALNHAIYHLSKK